MKMESNKKENKNDKVTDLNKDLIESKYMFCKYNKINNLSVKNEQFVKAYIITNEDYNNIIQNSEPKKRIEVKTYSNKDDIIKLNILFKILIKKQNLKIKKVLIYIQIKQ